MASISYDYWFNGCFIIFLGIGCFQRLGAHTSISMNRLSEQEDRYRMSLYRQGYNDREIAERCGVCKTTIYKWRRKQGLSVANTKYLNADID